MYNHGGGKVEWEEGKVGGEEGKVEGRGRDEDVMW